MNNPHLGSKTLLTALALGTAAASAENAQVNSNQAEREKREIELVEVHGIRSSLYSVQTSGDMRRIGDLMDQPVTITVLTKDQIEESGRTDLKDVLATQAGVTLGTGENGNAFGDRFIIRGHEARSDVFVDGLRDPGMNTRESFAVEQIEITKGPSGTFAGRGSSGGAVNSITKKASLDYDFGRVDLSTGSDEFFRGSIDVNTPVTENLATRINLLSASEDAPQRAGIERKREGGLLSLVYAPTQDLSVGGELYYLNAEDIPDLGTTKVNDVIIKDIPVYAQYSDFQNSEAISGTVRVEYEINSDWRLLGLARVGKTNNGYIATSAGGTRGYLTEEDATNQVNGFDTFSFGSHNQWQDIEHASTQINLFTDVQTGSVTHRLVFSGEYSDYSVLNGRYSNSGSPQATNCWTAGRRGISQGFCGLDSSGNSASGLRSVYDRSGAYKEGFISDYSYEAASFSAMDTIELTDALTIYGGLRIDSYEYSNLANGFGGESLYEFSDTLSNGQLGVVYEVMDEVNIYAAYGTATNINGGESDVGANCGYGGICTDSEGVAAAEPEDVENVEVGLKMSFNDETLFLQAAAFMLTKEGIMEAAGRGYDVTGSLNTGESEVTGFEIGLNGNLTDKLSIQLSAAIMDSEITKSASNPDTVGLPLALFADESLYAQARYQATPDFSFGGDVTYKGEMTGGQPDTGANGPTVPSYSVVNLFAQYNVSDKLVARLNWGNVGDKEYYTSTYRAPKFMYIGERESFRLSMSYEF